MPDGPRADARIEIDYAELLLRALENPRVAERFIGFFEIALQRNEARKQAAAGRTEWLNSTEMARHLKVSLRTFEREREDCPELQAMAVRKGKTLSWPVAKVKAWWDQHK